jgi:hypothetical protein
MILAILFAAAMAAVDPSTYVGNVYGSVDPPRAGVVVNVVDHGVTVRSGTTDADGHFLINNVPAPDDGRDYDVLAGDAALRNVHVLPGAVMALEVTLRSDSESTWHYRHERVLQLPARGGRAQIETFTATVFATREGLVGGTTANGHVIVPNDHFVALPSRRALARNLGYEHMVRLTYNGRTAVEPVWDIGPWNTRDDYWNPPEIRERFNDLPTGKPEAQAAFLEGYNGGKDERGRTVLNPAGIDLADGTFLDSLGLTNNAYVEVEYLWVEPFFRRRIVRH